jgi:NAD(P)-dependent dehydrogenase (short-subunit alcohol dehydrogenase family)
LATPADAADPASLESAFNQIRAEMDAPSVLVYNAAAINQGPPTEIDPEQLVADFRVNVAGALAAAQQVIPTMRQAGRGTILLTGGGLALNPYPDYCSLAVGKAGLRNLAFSLHDYLKPSGIHVATVNDCRVCSTGDALRAGSHRGDLLAASHAAGRLLGPGDCVHSGLRLTQIGSVRFLAAPL